MVSQKKFLLDEIKRVEPILTRIYKKKNYIMSEDKLDKIDRLISIKKINEAQRELAKLGPEFFKNSGPSFDNSN